MSAILRRPPVVKPFSNHPRVAVADDHAFMRDLISRELTRGDKHYDVVAAVGTAADAVKVCRRFEPNLLVLDVNLPDRSGVAAVPDIRRASPATRILLCTAFPKENWFGEANDCGADGFVEKTDSWDDFLLAVDRVSRGQRYFCSGGGPRRRDAGVNVRLTPRERQILKLIAGGLTTKEIAGRLFISVPTVETHRANLMTKTGARNVARLVRFAMNAGLS
ncbi:MAG TPA: response regulator transcription factor [Chthoniobacterales bacterium]|nr:response regulator transcription factor [Chthoniobacterales bacterium]